MELVDGDAESPTLISNVEVMELLKKNIDARNQSANANGSNNKKKKRNKHFRHRDWVEEEVNSYLMTTPCVKLDPSRRQEFHSKLKSRKKIGKSTTTTTNSVATAKVEEGHDNDADKDTSKMQQQLAGFGLTEAETLQIMNMMPTEPVEIHLMVDDLQSRMTETQQEEFLEFIASYCIPDGAAAGETSSQTDPMEVDQAVAKKWVNGQHNKHADNGVTIKQEDDEEESMII